MFFLAVNAHHHLTVLVQFFILLNHYSLLKNNFLSTHNKWRQFFFFLLSESLQRFNVNNFAKTSSIFFWTFSLSCWFQTECKQTMCLSWAQRKNEEANSPTVRKHNFHYSFVLLRHMKTAITYAWLLWRMHQRVTSLWHSDVHIA